MSADTAQTVGSVNVSGQIEDRAFFGLNKLLPVRKLQAGISYWGWAKMPPTSRNGLWMDWWLRKFLVDKRNDYDSISDLARLLEKELQNLVPPLSNSELDAAPYGGIELAGGIHLAGFIEENSKKLPCFWHVHNGLSQALPDKELDPHIVNANYDCPPQRYLEVERMGASYVTRNGDIEAFARFFQTYFTKYLEELNREMGISIPLPTIDSRAEFWRTQIRFVSELYAIAGIRDEISLRKMVRGIGGDVTTLTITEEGIHSYQTR